jgi:F0F1-type ATP synthase membrane subunit b/b'
MSAFLTTIFLFAEGGGGFYDKYLNYPGFEAWKFINLAIFIGAMIYLAGKPLSAAFKARRDQIREELIKAEEAKQAALVKLTAVEAKLAGLEAEKETVAKRAQEEAAFEARRIAEQTETEVTRIRQQADAELARLASRSQAELRRYSAEESVRLAAEKIRSQMDTDKDSRLIRGTIQEIGGLN